MDEGQGLYSRLLETQLVSIDRAGLPVGLAAVEYVSDSAAFVVAACGRFRAAMLPQLADLLQVQTIQFETRRRGLMRAALRMQAAPVSLRMEYRHERRA